LDGQIHLPAIEQSSRFDGMRIELLEGEMNFALKGGDESPHAKLVIERCDPKGKRPHPGVVPI